LVVESNYGDLYLGEKRDVVYTNEVVVKSNHGTVGLHNRMDRVEIQESTSNVFLTGSVTEHVDVKNLRGILLFYNTSQTE